MAIHTEDCVITFGVDIIGICSVVVLEDIVMAKLAFLSLYTARPFFEYYRQVYYVHSGLQDEGLQVTISKSP